MPLIKYDEDILNLATNYGEAARRVAQALDLGGHGISSTLITGAILEEYHDRNESWWTQFVQAGADGISAIELWSHDGVKAEYDQIKKLSPQERADINRLDEKVFDPIMIDLGVGNIQLYTAIRLLEEYNQTYKDTDPLALKHYNNDYVGLGADLRENLSPATVKFAGLMVKEGIVWSETHVANWNELDQAEREGLTVFYYNVGRDYMNNRYNNAIANPGDSSSPGSYRVDIGRTDIAQEYIHNKDAIVEAETTENKFYLVTQRLIADDYFKNPTNNSPGKLPETSMQGNPSNVDWSNIASTDYDYGAYGVRVETNFLGGIRAKEGESSRSLAFAVQDDNLLLTGNNWKVSSKTNNEVGFFVEVNGAISDGYQLGRSNVIQTLVSQEVGDLVRKQITPSDGSLVRKELPVPFSYLSGWSTDIAEIDPLVLDLDGDGVELTAFSSQYLFFDIDNDGHKERSGWVGGDDGMLVHDRNGDGKINNITETISEYYGASFGTGAVWASGFEALASLDSNSDGVIDSSDPAFGKLRVWQDINQNGETDNGELKTLAQLNISELSVQDRADGSFINGNEVKSNGSYRLNDGTSLTMAGVNFIADPSGLTQKADGTGVRVNLEEGDNVYYVLDEDGERVEAGERDVTSLIGSIGDDYLVGDERDNWLVGSRGKDGLFGNGGNDYLVADAADLVDGQENIQGGAGFDIVQFVGNEGVVFNLQRSQVEMAIGTDYKDFLVSGSSDQSVIIGGGGDDYILGGLADDTLSGEEGNDRVYGNNGNDLIRGHRGNDVLIGGEGNDIIQGGLGRDELFGDAGEDLLDGGAGDDFLNGGAGYDVAQYSGSYGDYEITANGDGSCTVTDRRANSPDGSDRLINVEALNFNDITEMKIDDENPMPVKDTVRVEAEEDGRTYRISIADLLANDIDYQGDDLSFRYAFNAKGGTVSLEGDEVVFIADEDFNGIPSFSYRIKDEQNNYGRQIIASDGQSAEMAGRVTLALDDHPGDPQFLDQWYLPEINALAVWDDYTGKGVKVGIFEPGPWDLKEHGHIDYNHPDLRPNISAEDLRTQNPNIEPTQHATLVAGVIGAARNDIGSVGVAYDVVLGSEGISKNDVSALSKWSDYDVANNSWGMNGLFGDNSLVDGNGNPLSRVFFENAINRGRGGLGSIVVLAAGNDRQDGSDTNAKDMTNGRLGITVGAINGEGDLSTLQGAQAPFSTPGASILISAPGTHVTSTSRLLENRNGSTFGGDYETTQGTSFASPIVSGVVALMLEANPNLGWRDVQEILAVSAKKPRDPNTEWDTNGSDTWNGRGMHYSHDYGFGLIDARAAVRLAETWQQQSYWGNENKFFYQSGELSQAIPDGSGTLSNVITVSDNIKLENIEVLLDLEHEQMGDVEIILTAPDGTTSILVNRPGVGLENKDLDRGYGNFDRTWMTSSTNHWGEKSAGDWTLTVRDKVTGKTGVLRNWELKLYGEQDNENDTYVYTDEFATMGKTVLSDSEGKDIINTSAVSGDVVIDLSQMRSSNIDGRSLSLSSGTVIEEVYSGDGNDFLRGNGVVNKLYGGRGDDELHAHFEGNLVPLSGDKQVRHLTSGVDILSIGDASNFYVSDTSVTGSYVDGTMVAVGSNHFEGFDLNNDLIDLRSLSSVTSINFNTVTTPNGRIWAIISTQSGGMIMLADVDPTKLTANNFINGNQRMGDILLGGADEDVFYNSMADDYFGGGSGVDRVVYSDDRSNYTIATTDKGVSIVDNRNGIKDSAVEVEEFEFASINYSIDDLL